MPAFNLTRQLTYFCSYLSSWALPFRSYSFLCQSQHARSRLRLFCMVTLTNHQKHASKNFERRATIWHFLLLCPSLCSAIGKLLVDHAMGKLLVDLNTNKTKFIYFTNTNENIFVQINGCRINQSNHVK